MHSSVLNPSIRGWVAVTARFWNQGDNLKSKVVGVQQIRTQRKASDGSCVSYYWEKEKNVFLHSSSLSVLIRHCWSSSPELTSKPSFTAFFVLSILKIFARPMHRDSHWDQRQYCVQDSSTCTNYLLNLSCRKNRLHCTLPLAWVKQRLSSFCSSTWPTLMLQRLMGTPHCTSRPERDKLMLRQCS